MKAQETVIQDRTYMLVPEEYRDTLLEMMHYLQSIDSPFYLESCGLIEALRDAPTLQRTSDMLGDSIIPKSPC
jgi:hypothetical protein